MKTAKLIVLVERKIEDYYTLRNRFYQLGELTGEVDRDIRCKIRVLKQLLKTLRKTKVKDSETS